MRLACYGPKPAQILPLLLTPLYIPFSYASPHAHICLQMHICIRTCMAAQEAVWDGHRMSSEVAMVAFGADAAHPVSEVGGAAPFYPTLPCNQFISVHCSCAVSLIAAGPVGDSLLFSNVSVDQLSQGDRLLLMLLPIPYLHLHVVFWRNCFCMCAHACLS